MGFKNGTGYNLHPYLGLEDKPPALSWKTVQQWVQKAALGGRDGHGHFEVQLKQINGLRRIALTLLQSYLGRYAGLIPCTAARYTVTGSFFLVGQEGRGVWGRSVST